jgi:imidazolonepropionase-like amidohydrolase
MRSVLPSAGLLIGLAIAGSAVRASAPTPFAPPGPAFVEIFRHATLIDGRGGSPARDMAVVIRGQRISEVLADRALDPTVMRGATVVDLKGQFLMPGLIDSHVHLATPPNRRQAQAVLRRDIFGGVTAVRDMADDMRAIGDLQRASITGEIPAPDIYYAALMAGPAFFSDPRTSQSSVGDIAGKVPWMRAVDDKTNIPEAVAMARGTYATGIKLYADLAAPLAKRIVDEAHRQGMLVWAHSTLFPAKPSEVVDAGVDVISHSCLLIYQASEHVPDDVKSKGDIPFGQFVGSNSRELAPVFADMVKRGTILDATVWIYGAVQTDQTSNPQIARHKCDERIGGAITRQAYSAGVQISTGTDYFAPWTDSWPDVFHEMEVLVHSARMSPVAVIKSATIVGAKTIGRGSDMGSIEAGKLANLIVLSRNPIENIENLKTVEMTVRRGRIYRRTDFIPLQNGDVEDE